MLALAEEMLVTETGVAKISWGAGQRAGIRCIAFCLADFL